MNDRKIYNQMNEKEFKDLLTSLGACSEAKEWSEGKSFKEVWTTCERGDWMLWLFNKMQDEEGWGDLRNKTLAKVRCARLVQHLMKDDRSLYALDVAERFANGKATRDELDAAAADADADDDDAAYSAYSAYATAAYATADAAAYAAAAAADDDDDAAYSAYSAAAAATAAAYAAAASAAAAARNSTLKQCADICRETLITPINIHQKNL